MSKAKTKNPQIRIGALCRKIGISKNYYYRPRTKLMERDLINFKIIKKHHDKGKSKNGIRQLEMIIPREEGLIMNHKKIARIKNRFGLKTIIRLKNKYRYFAKKKQEHETCPNLLDRNFKGLKADQVYVTDITTLKYSGKKAYVAAVKDLETKEIVGLSVSHRIDINLTNSSMEEALKKLTEKQKKKLIVHSDQGFHFTHVSFRRMLALEGVTQSMSRKGNCIDNAPMESFFGLIKDHIDLKNCRTIKEVEKEVTKKVDYYNKVRPQVGLKKMPPYEYRRHFY